jgi:hypothetical protein
LYEEKDYPLESKIIFENKDNGMIQRESSWRDELKGFNLFADGNLKGSDISYIHANGVSISHWQGTFIPINSSPSDESTRISFIGRDTNTNNKFIVIRTFFSNDVDEVRWLDGLICIAEWIFDLKDNCFKSTGYEWTKNKTWYHPF